MRRRGHGVVRELDVHAFAGLSDTREHDYLVTFFRSDPQYDSQVTAMMRALQEASDRLATASVDSVRIAAYNVTAHGLPRGVHFHDAAFVALFPISESGRNPVEYEFAHDSEHGAASGGDSAYKSAYAHAHEHNHDHEYDHDHDHDHQHVHFMLTANGVLEFLRRQATFTAEIPALSLADKWRGKDVYQAVSTGLQVLRSQHDELMDEVLSLRQRVAALSTALRSCRAERLANGTANVDAHTGRSSL